MNISTKLIVGSIGFSAIIAIALSYILFNVQSTSSISVTQQSLVNEQLTAIKQQEVLQQKQVEESKKLKLAIAIDQEYRDLRAWLLDLSVSWLNEAEDKANESFDRLQAQLGDLAEIDQSMSVTIQEKSTQFYDLMMEAVDAYVDENRVKGNSLIADGRLITLEIETLIRQLQSSITENSNEISAKAAEAGKVVTQSGNKVRASADNVVSKNSWLLNMSIVILFVIVGLSILFSYLMKREVCTPIERLKDTVEKIQHDSDLTARFEVRTMDEIGVTGTAFNLMMEQFADIVRQVSESCIELDEAISHLVNLMQQANESVVSQQQATEQVATAITQMAATVQSVAQHTEHATESTSGAKTVAADGRKMVDSSISETQELSGLMDKANRAIIDVDKQSTEIGKVLDVIGSISEQTNLLALNAAIEAARAGEAGRGFAVVADEVRTLAQRTQESTSEINSIIDNLQSGTQNAVDLMSHGNEEALSVSEQATDTGEAFRTIEANINEINDLNTMIATSAEEQSMVADDINKNIININDSFSTTTEVVENTVSASENILKFSHNLASLVKQFKV